MEDVPTSVNRISSSENITITIIITLHQYQSIEKKPSLLYSCGNVDGWYIYSKMSEWRFGFPFCCSVFWSRNLLMLITNRRPDNDWNVLEVWHGLILWLCTSAVKPHIVIIVSRASIIHTLRCACGIESYVSVMVIRETNSVKFSRLSQWMVFPVARTFFRLET